MQALVPRARNGPTVMGPTLMATWPRSLRPARTPGWMACEPTQDSGCGQVWIGGYQAADPRVEPGDGWAWVNGEGPFPGDNTGPAYANWHSPPKPNNTGGDREPPGAWTVRHGWWLERRRRPLSARSAASSSSTTCRVASASCTAATECQTIEGQNLIHPHGMDKRRRRHDQVSLRMKLLIRAFAKGTCGDRAFDTVRRRW